MDETNNSDLDHIYHIMLVFISNMSFFLNDIVVIVAAVVVPTRFQWTVNGEYSWPAVLKMTPIV